MQQVSSKQSGTYGFINKNRYDWAHARDRICAAEWGHQAIFIGFIKQKVNYLARVLILQTWKFRDQREVAMFFLRIKKWQRDQLLFHDKLHPLTHSWNCYVFNWKIIFICPWCLLEHSLRDIFDLGFRAEIITEVSQVNTSKLSRLLQNFLCHEWFK